MARPRFAGLELSPVCNASRLSSSERNLRIVLSQGLVGESEQSNSGKHVGFGREHWKDFGIEVSET